MNDINSISKRRCIIAFVTSVSIIMASFLDIIISILIPVTETVPVHIINVMHKEYGGNYTDKELYSAYLRYFLDNEKSETQNHK